MTFPPSPLLTPAHPPPHPPSATLHTELFLQQVPPCLQPSGTQLSAPSAIQLPPCCVTLLPLAQDPPEHDHWLQVRMAGWLGGRWPGVSGTYGPVNTSFYKIYHLIVYFQ